MNTPRKKKNAQEKIEEDDDVRPVRFEALAELTSSEVVDQLKAGMSRITPLELEGEDDMQDDAVNY